MKLRLGKLLEKDLVCLASPSIEPTESPNNQDGSQPAVARFTHLQEREAICRSENMFKGLPISTIEEFF